MEAKIIEFNRDLPSGAKYRPELRRGLMEVFVIGALYSRKAGLSIKPSAYLDALRGFNAHMSDTEETDENIALFNGELHPFVRGEGMYRGYCVRVRERGAREGCLPNFNGVEFGRKDTGRLFFYEPYSLDLSDTSVFPYVCGHISDGRLEEIVKRFRAQITADLERGLYVLEARRHNPFYIILNPVKQNN